MEPNKYEAMIEHATNEIREYYKHSCVFITGGTGFLGKLLIAKLLRECPELSTIYILVRNKRGHGIKQRIDMMLQDVIFEKLLSARPDATNKIIGITGDVSELNLGMSENDRETIAENVTAIFHVAAAVKFDEHIKLAVAINVQGTKEMLVLAKTCKKLTSYVHVSTAYSHYYRVNENIDEKFYDTPQNAAELIELVRGKDEATLTKMTPRILGKWPNSYVFTKAVAENTVKLFADNLPIAVFRPAIVIATYQEPLPGWIDNFNGPAGFNTATMAGVLHVFHADFDQILNIIPGDMVVNAMIGCSYQTARRYANRNSRPLEMRIYNYVSSTENPITFREHMKRNKAYMLNYPTKQAVWYYSLYVTNSWYVYIIMSVLFHLIPGLILDGLAVLTGKKPQVLKMCKRMYKFNDMVSFVMLNYSNFTNNNTQELWNQMSAASRKAFPFSMAEMSWERHSETYTIGLRTYLLKESMNTLPEARKKWRRLYILHNFVKCLFLSTTAYFSWSIITSIYDLVL